MRNQARKSTLHCMSSRPLRASAPLYRRVTSTAIGFTLSFSLIGAGAPATAQTATIPQQVKWITGFTLASKLQSNQPTRAWLGTDIYQHVGIRRFGNFTGNPTLELVNAPAGLNVIVLGNPIGATVLGFYVHADPSTPVGWYNTRLRGRAGAYSASVAFPIYVGVPGPNIVAVEHFTESGAAGDVADFVFKITPTQGTTAPDVDLGLGLPENWIYDQAQDNDRVWVRLIVPASTAPGPKTFDVYTQSGVYSSTKISVTLTVL